MFKRSSINRYILHLTEYEIVVCWCCNYCISSMINEIKRHFMKEHKSVSLNTRREISEYCKLLKLANSNEIHILTVDIKSIESLTIFSDWRCQEKSNKSECRECCTSEELMKRHYKNEHEWSIFKKITWTKQSFQTFFRDNLIKYFLVIISENDDAEHVSSMNYLTDDLLEKADQRDETHWRAINKVTDSQNLMTLTLWLRRTEWLRMFTKQNMKMIVNLVRLSNKEKNRLRRICESITWVIKECSF